MENKANKMTRLDATEWRYGAHMGRRLMLLNLLDTTVWSPGAQIGFVDKFENPLVMRDISFPFHVGGEAGVPEAGDVLWLANQWNVFWASDEDVYTHIPAIDLSFEQIVGICNGSVTGSFVRWVDLCDDDRVFIDGRVYYFNGDSLYDGEVDRDWRELMYWNYLLNMHEHLGHPHPTEIAVMNTPEKKEEDAISFQDIVNSAMKEMESDAYYQEKVKMYNILKNGDVAQCRYVGEDDPQKRYIAAKIRRIATNYDTSTPTVPGIEIQVGRKYDERMLPLSDIRKFAAREEDGMRIHSFVIQKEAAIALRDALDAAINVINQM